jgi:CcmD family protein
MEKVAGSRQQAAGSRQLAASSRRQTAGSWQQTAVSRQQAAGSWQQAAGSRQQAAGSWQQAAGRVLALVLLLVFVSATGVAIAAQRQPPPQTPAQEGFVPVDRLPAQEQLPATPLVIGAYAVAWIAVFGYLVSIWARLGKVEREIQAVSRRVESEGRR